MPKTIKGKSKKKAASRKPVKKTVKKKVAKKKITKKKTLKKAVKKTARKKAAKKSKSAETPIKSKPTMIEPGPPPRTIPPVEEPASNEEAIGTVTHYYSHLGVAVVQINKGTLRTGNTIHVKGHATDFTQPVESMEYEHQHIDQAAAGQSVGLKVKDHAREHDIVFVLK
jgi:translation elongation factor EF-Tu-like GTPase